MNKKTYNPFETAQKQFDRAADLLELDQATIVYSELEYLIKTHHPSPLGGGDCLLYIYHACTPWGNFSTVYRISTYIGSIVQM